MMLTGFAICALLSVPALSFAQDGAPAQGLGLGHGETTLAVFVVAGLYYTCLGWARKLYRRAQGQSVPIDWVKVRNAAITGTVLGLVAWTGVWLGILPVSPDFYDEHFNFALMFGFATTAVLSVHRFMLTAPEGPARPGSGGTSP